MFTVTFHLDFILFVIITVKVSNVLPLRFDIEQPSTPLNVNFTCFFDDESSDVTEICFWYKPQYPTANKIVLYQWMSKSDGMYVFDPIKQNRVSGFVNLNKKMAVLSINYPVLHDSGTYHCEMTFPSENRIALPVKYWRINTDVESITCESSEQVYGKTGVLSCFYQPIFSSPLFIIWSRRISGVKKEVYKYSFLHGRGENPEEIPWLLDRVSHKVDIRTGKTSLSISNTGLSDTGLYTVEVNSRFASVTEDIHYSVEDHKALRFMVTSTEENCLTVSGDYHYQAFFVSRIEWYLVECDKESLLLKYDVLKGKTQVNRHGISHTFNDITGRFSLMWREVDILPLGLRCNMDTSQGPLRTNISIQYIKGMENKVKPIINTWPERVFGEDAKAVCRRMCSALPDMSSIYVKKHISEWLKTSNLDEVWISKKNTTMVSIGKIKTPQKCFIIQHNNLKPKEKLCVSKTPLICIHLKHTKTPQENKEGDFRDAKVPVIIILTLLVSITFGLIRRMSNKTEYFRRPWEYKRHKKLYTIEEIQLLKDNSQERSSGILDFERINKYTVNMRSQLQHKKPVVVGIMSSGFDMEHPIFQDQLPEPWHHIATKGIRGKDLFGQGTFLAGVIIELCKNVPNSLQLLNLQAVSEGGKITTNTVKSCLNYCLSCADPPDILLIPNCFTNVLNSHLRPLLEQLMVKTVVVISASNDVRSPIDMNQMSILANLVIGSHDELFEKCKDSPNCWGVDFLAPGSSVISAKSGSKHYISGSGTVVASASVCGILVHVMLQARCIAQKYELSVEYTTWMMHNVLLAMTEEKVKIPGKGYGPLIPERVLLNDEKLKSIIRAASAGEVHRLA